MTTSISHSSSVYATMLLDDENETLDWGNEEEEYQESHRTHYSVNKADTLAGDDVEDTISLGDDEDDQRFYSLSRPDVINSSASNVDQLGSTPLSHTKSTSSGANTTQPGQRSPKHPTAVHVPVHESPVNEESPQKNSSIQQSPTRSVPRLTHALPPKPVAASVTALSYPPIIAATTMTSISPRSAGRDSKKINGKLGLSPASADLPQDWETRSSRRGETYYYNRVTHECTWTLPVSKPSVVAFSVQEDSKSRRQRRSVSPGGNKKVTSFDSNPSQLQNSRSNKDFSRTADIEERRRPLTPDENGLTFEDRHYRPGVNSVPISDGARAFDRSAITANAGRNPRSLSPRWRRSNSPPGSKGGEPHFMTKELSRDQGKPLLSRTSSSAPKLDSYIPDYNSQRRAPSPSPRAPADHLSRRQREPDSYGASKEDCMQVDASECRPGPSLRREEVDRNRQQRSRNRDPPTARGMDVHELSASQNFFSAQRSRSPALLLPLRKQDRDIWDGKRDAREGDYHQGSASAPHNHNLISAPQSDRTGKDEHTERVRPRQYERSYDIPDQRESLIDDNVNSFKGRNVEQEKIREGERSEVDRNVLNARRERNARTDDDPLSMQPPASYPSEPRAFQGNTKSKRKTDDHKPEDSASARPKRAPLPPQQASFRSAQVRDPHPISIPSKQLEDDAHAVAGAGDDALSYEPRKFLTVQSSSLDVSRDVELERLRDDYGRHERHQLPYEQNETTYLDKRTDARDITLNLGRRQLGPPHRGMPEDFQRSSNISSDAGRREQPLRPRALINDNGRRDSDYDRLKDEKPVDREGGFVRDVRPLDGSNPRRGREVPRQPARLTGTNNVPIGNRRTVVQTGTTTQRPGTMSLPVAPLDPEVSSSGAIPAHPSRNLPPGKESYERPVDTLFSTSSRHPGPSSRTSGKDGSLHEPQQTPMRKGDEGRGRKPNPHPLAVAKEYSNGSTYRPSTPALLSRDSSGSLPSNLPDKLSAYPSEVGIYSSQNVDPSAKSRGSYRHKDESTGREPHKVLRQLSYSPKQPPDEADGSLLSPGGDSLRRRKSGGAGPNVDARLGDSSIDRSDFISRVEAPPLRRGGSLLDRLSIADKDCDLSADSLLVSSTSLRDRLVPSKRDRDEMMNNEGSSGRGEISQDFEGNESKRAKKRGGKRRSAARRT